MTRLFRRHFVAFFATLALSLPAAATSYSIDYTDLWWAGAQESGWGLQLTQLHDVIFATAFVYHSDRSAHWYSATLNPVGGSTNQYAGDLIESTGPWLGSPTFDPNSVTRTTVGSMTITFSTPNSGSLTYSVGGVQVAKQISRLNVRNNNLVGIYLGGLVGRSTNCSGVPNGQILVFDNLTVTQTGTALTMRVDFFQGGTGISSTCTYTGTLSQAGRLSTINNGSFNCTVGGSPANAGSFTMTGIDVQLNGFHSTFAGQDQFCTYNGRFGGIRDVP
jgi:hypothetical protein